MRQANAVDKASSREVRTALQEMILGRFISTTRNVWSADGRDKIKEAAILGIQVNHMVLQAKSEDDRIGLRECVRPLLE